jgi:hypothetical protein
MPMLVQKRTHATAESAAKTMVDRTKPVNRRSGKREHRAWAAMKS